MTKFSLQIEMHKEKKNHHNKANIANNSCYFRYDPLVK